MQIVNKFQKKALLRWIAEGLETDEINERARAYDPSFELSKQQVSYYRTSRFHSLKAITKKMEAEALTTGLARKEIRVAKLARLADEVERDLLESLWLEKVKVISFGDAAERVYYEEFNKAGIDAYRGLVEDIAKEMGERSQRVQLGGEVKVESTNGLPTGEQLVAGLTARLLAASPEERAGLLAHYQRVTAEARMLGNKLQPAPVAQITEARAVGEVDAVEEETSVEP